MDKDTFHRVVQIVRNARQPVTNAMSLSELDRHLDTIINIKATIIRHLREAFPDAQ